MKKYQLWLERKSYSQHLFNLMKIRHVNVADKQDHSSPVFKTGRVKQNLIPSRFRQNQISHIQAEKLGDISFAIRSKQLRNRKLRIMKIFEINNENINMARRIREVKPAFNPNKDKKCTSYGKRKVFQNKCELTNEELREQNFKKFQKWQSSRVGPHHKYRLSVAIEAIYKFINVHDDYAAFWCEIQMDKGFAKSQMIELNCFSGHEFSFPLETELSASFLLRLYICKGLQSEMIGEYNLLRPELGKAIETQYKSSDHGGSIDVRLFYQKICRQQMHLTVK